MRRIVAAFLPYLRIELARVSLEDDNAPLALVLARPDGVVKDERSLLGNTRLDEVCPEGRARGLRPRQTIASARARCSDLQVRVVALDSVRDELSRIAVTLLAYGATTSFDLETNVLWVDVTGCAHLHRSDADPSGEMTLANRIQRCVEQTNHACRVAIADGPVVAASVARFRTGGPRISVVPYGGSKAAMAALPIAALPLTGDAVQWLSRLGMRAVGDLQRLPRRSLATRLGSHAPKVMALLDGEDSTPLRGYVAPVVPEEAATLEYGIESTDALQFVVKGLVDRLARCLDGRVMAATCLELELGLDRALADGRDLRPVVRLPLAAPLVAADELFRVLRARVEALTIDAPILSVKLRAAEMIPRTAVPLHLFVPEAKADRAIPRLVAELEAELGPGTVGVLAMANRWDPSERSKLVPIGSNKLSSPVAIPSPDSPKGGLLSGAKEPTRLLAEPIPIDGVEDVQWHVRHEAVEWWTAGGSIIRHRGTAWIEPFGAMAWVELDPRERRLWIRGWMD